jgi:hypothetical protein
MSNSIFNLFILSVIFINGCRSQNSLQEDCKNCQVIFGSGGGFTGKVNEYTLNNNGDIFLNNTLKNQNSKVKTLAPSQTKDIFNKLKSLDLNKIQFRHPGNLYYFLKFKSNNAIYEVTWGDNKNPAPAEILDFYKFLMAIVNEK